MCVNEKELPSIDIDGLIEISQSILTEIDSKSLYKKLIRFIMKYYMAERVLIFLPYNNGGNNKECTIIEGKRGVEDLNFQKSIILEDNINVVYSIVNHAFNSKENIILHGESLKNLKSLISKDNWNDFENIICSPLIHREKVLGVVYIEKQFYSLEYNEDKFKLLKLILIQAAAAIEKINSERCKLHQVERELRESEERYRRLFELSPDAICVHSEGKIVLANPAIERLYDVDNPKGIIGKNVIDFIHPNYREIAGLRIKHITEGGISTPFIEEKFITKNGEVIDVEVATTAFLYNNKPAVQVVARDISDRRKMEKALRENEALLRQITENTLDMILKVNINGDIQYATPSHKYILGYELEDILGKNVFEFIPEEDKLAASLAFRSLFFNTQQDNKVKFRCKCIEGNYVWVEIGGRILYDSEKNVIGAILSSRDITKNIEAERALMDNEEKTKLLNQAVEYDKLRTEFFANLSHELRTPINVILGTIQLIEFKLRDVIFSEKYTYQKYMKTMKQNSFRLIRLINNLIDVTKIDSGYFELHLSNYNIINIVEEITLSVAEYVQNKGITLLFDTEVEERILACDADKIERIMLNLISNSIKFTEPGGKIEVNIYDEEHEIIISVKDTGIGIPIEKQEQVFERFVQVDKSLAKNKEGSGIGLSLVKSLIEMHEGTIELKSEWTKGSEFIIKLPVRVLSHEEIFIPNNYNHNGNIEKINVEFSDIYL